MKHLKGVLNDMKGKLAHISSMKCSKIKSIIFFQMVDPLDLFLLRHTFLVHIASCTIKLSNGLAVLMFPFGDVDHWTSVKGEVKYCIFLNHLFPETVAGT